MELTVNIKLDTSSAKSVLDTCRTLSKTVEVGILHDEEEASIGKLQHDGGVGVYQYGKYEGQAVNVPSRPFLFLAMEHFGKELLESDVHMLKEFNEKNAENIIKRVGEKAVDCVKAEIDGFARAGGNSPKTIETKGKDSPLIDTGKMRESIEYEVIG